MAVATLSDYQTSTWTGLSSANEATASITWSAGDLIVVMGATETQGNTLNTPTATGLTFGLVTSTSGASDCQTYCWSAVAGAGGSGAVTCTHEGASAMRGIAAYVFTGSAGTGATALQTPGADVDTISLTRVGTNSRVICLLADWSAASDVTVDPDPAGGTQRHADYESGRATFFLFDWGDQGNPGTTAYGVTNHTGTTDTVGIALEIYGSEAPVVITFIDGTSPTTTAAPGRTGNGDLTIAFPDGYTPTEGHFALAVLYSDQGSGSEPTDWTEVTGSPWGTTAHLQAFYKILAGGDSAPVTTISGSGTNISHCGVMVIYSNVDATTPIDAVGTASAGTGSPMTAGSVDTQSDGAMALGLCGRGDNETSSTQTFNTSAAGVNERVDAGTDAGADSQVSIYDKLIVAQGATGNGSAATSATDPWVSVIITLTKVASGPPAYTLTAAAGSFSLSGHASTLKPAAKLIGTAGAVTLSGIAAALRQGYMMGGAAGAYTLAGQTAGLRAATRLPASSSSFALEGLAGGLRIGARLPSAPAAFALDGQSAVLRAAGRMPADAMPFVLTGIDGGLRAAVRLPIDPATFTLTGLDAALLAGTAYRLIAEAAAVVLTGQDAGLRVAARVPGEAMAVVLTGLDAVLRLGAFYTLAAETGAFALAGPAATLRAVGRLVTVPGMLVLTGQDVTLVVDEEGEPTTAAQKLIQLTELMDLTTVMG